MMIREPVHRSGRSLKFIRLPVVGQLNVVVPLKPPNRCSLKNKCIGVGNFCLIRLFSFARPAAQIYSSVEIAQLMLIREPMYRSGRSSKFIRLPIVGQFSFVVPLKSPNRCSLNNKCIGVGFGHFLLGDFPGPKKRLPATALHWRCGGIPCSVRR